MIRAALALALLLAATAAGAEGRVTLDADAIAAVGRLDIDGTRSCTATLISDRRVLTAAHCLFHPRTGQRVPVSDLRFVPARGIAKGNRGRRVQRAAVLPGFSGHGTPDPESLRRDIALLDLAGPVPPQTARPIAIAPLHAGAPSPAIIAYPRRHARMPTIEPDCPILGQLAEVVMLGCGIEAGVSGAPVLVATADGPMLVAVVSSMGKLPGGNAFALAVVVADRIDALRTELAGR